ncbi:MULTISPECIES: short-chain dehydrogenase [unclassified Coleofasciculus]|uniref:short-chain dehydrogenase n=1 Tax=Cyanophyceae TaxID=3028117 RepID=UPI0016891278|nr:MULTISPECIES: short-chain dehydrogenase [unclassified Coleofasciculus]MBD1880414.1 short-chain dehydrogenase [Coleofasciculus sp. FACHB-T130]MBD1901196.1 short-chain dehydrogenase [Coleofasciculus sp. FACHB-125]
MVDTNQNNDFPSSLEFFFRVPLYKTFDITGENWPKVLDVEFFRETLDAYCIECKKDSTFIHDFEKRTTEYKKTYAFSERIFCNVYKCSRNASHRIDFCFKVYNEKIQKFGQAPSIADLTLNKIGKYKKILSTKKYNELSKAIGLVSHGVGIGSFVYLRRIFEDLVEQAHQEAIEIKKDSWNEETYCRSRMDEKIGLLKEFLPDFLFRNRIIYSILSKGIHELSEEECLKYFDAVKIGIELILDEKLERSNREAKTKEVEKLLSEIHNELK